MFYLRSFATVVAHVDERFELVLSQLPLPVHVSKARRTEVIAALLAPLNSHLFVFFVRPHKYLLVRVRERRRDGEVRKTSAGANTKCLQDVKTHCLGLKHELLNGHHVDVSVSFAAPCSAMIRSPDRYRYHIKRRLHRCPLHSVQLLTPRRR